MDLNMLGAYGSWAADLVDAEPGAYSFRHPRWDDLEQWSAAGRERLHQRLAPPPLPDTPVVTIEEQTMYEDVTIETVFLLSRPA